MLSTNHQYLRCRTYCHAVTRSTQPALKVTRRYGIRKSSAFTTFALKREFLNPPPKRLVPRLVLIKKALFGFVVSINEAACARRRQNPCSTKAKSIARSYHQSRARVGRADGNIIFDRMETHHYVYIYCSSFVTALLRSHPMLRQSQIGSSAEQVRGLFRGSRKVFISG